MSTGSSSSGATQAARRLQQLSDSAAGLAAEFGSGYRGSSGGGGGGGYGHSWSEIRDKNKSAMQDTMRFGLGAGDKAARAANMYTKITGSGGGMEGTAGKVAGGGAIVLTALVGIYKFTRAIYEVARDQAAAFERLAPYSASLSMEQGMLNIQRLQQDVKMAQEGGGGAVIRGTAELEDKFFKYEMFNTKLKNLMIGGAAQGLARGGSATLDGLGIGPLVLKLNTWLNKALALLPGNEPIPDGAPLFQLIKDLQIIKNVKHDPKNRRPNR